MRWSLAHPISTATKDVASQVDAPCARVERLTLPVADCMDRGHLMKDSVTLGLSFSNGRLPAESESELATSLGVGLYGTDEM